MNCIGCVHCIRDERPSAYMRDPVYFCRRRTRLFSRNCRPGEGGRIRPEDAACPEFRPADMASPEEP